MAWTQIAALFLPLARDQLQDRVPCPVGSLRNGPARQQSCDGHHGGYVSCGALYCARRALNDKGEHRYCYKSTTGPLSNIGAMQEYNKCLNEAGAAGFKLEK